MAHNKLYRNFIILQEDEKNKSSSKDKALSGYAKIEAKGEKCKITFYAQNLKKDDDYAIVLICYKKDLKQIIDIGPLSVNEVGKGEACIEYYSDNIAGLSLGYDKISGAGICKKNNGYIDFSMYGFMNGVKLEENWKKMKVITSYDKSNVSKQKEYYKNDNKKDNDKDTKDNKIDYKKLEDEKQNNIKVEKEEDLNYKNDNNLNDKDVEYKKLEDDKEYSKNDYNEKDDYNVESSDDIKEYCQNNCGEEQCNRDNSTNNNNTVDTSDILDSNDTVHTDDIVESNETLDNNNLRNEAEDSDDYDDNLSDIDNDDRGKKKHSHDHEHCKKNDHDKLIKKHDHEKCDYHKKFEHHKHEEDWMDNKKKNYDNCDYDYDVKEYKKKSHDYYCDRDSLVETFEEYERKIEEQRLDPYNFSLRGKVGNFFENLVKGFDEMKEGFKELPYCKWFKVPINDIDDMCNTKDYNKYSIIYYPMLNYYPYIKKYGYFMTGYKCDSKGNLKYLVYAIPGKKDREEQPYCGKSGFVTWCKKEYDDNGFWLMFYDYKNSTIVVPSK